MTRTRRRPAPARSPAVFALSTTLGLRRREREGEATATAGTLAEGDAPAMPLDDPLAEREAEPEPARAGAVPAHVGLEHALALLRTDPGAVVGDDDLDHR